MRNVFIILACALFIFTLIPLASAEVQSLGSAKQNECIQLVQSCTSCTYVNVTTVQLPNKDIESIFQEMEVNGFSYNYTFCGTSQIGMYIATTCGDIDGTNTCVSYDFDITPSGFAQTLGFYFLVLVIISSVVVLGFWIQEEWFIILGGMGLIIFGVYSLNFGVAGFRDMFLTWTVSLFEIGVGTILAILASLEKMN